MTFSLRDGNFDLAVVAGPRLETWPSIGVRTLTSFCAEMGLKVGVFGGDTLTVQGVIPLPGTGGMLLAQDVQERIHRIQARAVVRVSSNLSIPDPFHGSHSQGMIPLSTANRLRRESEVLWEGTVVVLGTGNRALRFASSLLQSGTLEVFCVETYAQWGAKRFAGWEVERRRFEMLGGRVLEAKPIKLTAKAPLLWELKLLDSQGVRVMDVARVVSVGPFRDAPELREYPPGSYLFELTQTAGATIEEDADGWKTEEERGRWLGGRIVKALVNDLGPKREELDRTYRRARVRLKRYLRHRTEPFTPAYQGKWISAADAKEIRAFPGVPQQEQRARPVASIECFEEIPCNLCQTACPEDAITIGRIPRIRDAEDTILNESRCTACGLCLKACPSQATLLIHEMEDRSLSRITLPWRGPRPWAAGEFAVLTNRRGDALGSARVVALPEPVAPAGLARVAREKADPVQLVELEVPTHLVWEARGLKRMRNSAASDEAYFAAITRSSSAEKKVEITLDGEKRLVRDQIPVTTALFEMGQSRPEDVLFCPDGSCSLCMISVDGVKKLACQTQVHRGMAIRREKPTAPAETNQARRSICPCMGITTEEVLERMSQGKLQSPEAVIEVTHLGEGKCHGQLCLDPFRRVLQEQNLDSAQWIDWRFPWSDWVLRHN